MSKRSFQQDQQETESIVKKARLNNHLDLRADINSLAQKYDQVQRDLEKREEKLRVGQIELYNYETQLKYLHQVLTQGLECHHRRELHLNMVEMQIRSFSQQLLAFMDKHRSGQEIPKLCVKKETPM